MEINKIVNGDSYDVLKTLPDKSIDCVVTSPPYWSLRDYNIEGQLGRELTFEEYLINLYNIFNEVKRVLKDEGTLFVNLGDVYSGTGHKKDNKDPKFSEGRNGQKIALNNKTSVPKKSLCCIPDRFKIEMVSRGWICRNEIIWHKPNAMPSSANDRFTVDYEKVFFFTKKSSNYKFNQQLEPYTQTLNRRGGNKLKAEGISEWCKNTSQKIYRKRDFRPNKEGRNKRCVWSINTKPSKEKHYATFPIELIKYMILSGSNENDLILDPFMGVGTTAICCIENNRNYIGIELNPEYCVLCENRIKEFRNNFRNYNQLF